MVITKLELHLPNCHRRVNNPLEDDIRTRPYNEVRNPEPWELLKRRFKYYIKNQINNLLWMQLAKREKENMQQLTRLFKAVSPSSKMAFSECVVIVN